MIRKSEEFLKEVLDKLYNRKTTPAVVEKEIYKYFEPVDLIKQFKYMSLLDQIEIYHNIARLAGLMLGCITPPVLVATNHEAVLHIFNHDIEILNIMEDAIERYKKILIYKHKGIPLRKGINPEIDKIVDKEPGLQKFKTIILDILDHDNI